MIDGLYALCVAAFAVSALAQDDGSTRIVDPLASPINWDSFAASQNDPEPYTSFTQEAFERGWNSSAGSGEDSEPGHIRDNAFLVEEAFNQEAGEVQHIFNWIQLWDRTGAGETRDFVNTYTMEIPVGSQRHQFSFTTQYLSLFERPIGQPPEHQGGVGDTFLNYRYQLLADDEFLWASPRFSVIIPSGDERFGLGSGRVGYQFNLPISRYGEEFDFHFNAGYTITPDVVARLPAGPPFPEHDIDGYNLGGSVFWKPQVYLNFFVEALALWNDEIDDAGNQLTVRQVFLNPGARYAVCQFEQVEWVLGVSVPVGLTSDTPDIGAFAYMSVEHMFRKVDE